MPVTSNNPDVGKKRYMRFVPQAALLGAAIFVFWDLVFGGATLYLRDITSYHLPYFRFIHERFLSGSLPSWNPYTEFGEPLVALGFTGAFYPAQFIMMLMPDLLSAFNFMVVLHVALAGCFMYWCARALGCSVRGSFIAGAAWAFGPEMISMSIVPNTFFGVTWLPAAVAAYVSIMKSGPPARPGGVCRGILLLIALVFFVAMMLLAGAFQVALLSVIIMACFGAVRTVWPDRDALSAAKPGRGRKALLAASALVVAIILGTLLAAAQVFPTRELFSNSVRAAGYEAHGYSYGARYALQWIRLPEIFLPALFGPVMPSGNYGLTLLHPDSTVPIPYFCTIYLGIGALALAVYGAAARRSALTWLLAGMSVFGILAGLGDGFPPPSWIIAHVPLLRSFRYAEKWFCLAAFAVPLLAGFGYDSAAAATGKWKDSAPVWLRRLFGALAAVLVAAVILLAVTAFIDENIWVRRFLASFSHAAGAATLVAGLLAKYGRETFRQAKPATILCLVIVAELALAARYQTFTMPRSKHGYKAALANMIREKTGRPEINGWTYIREQFPKMMPPVEDADGRALGIGEQFVWQVNRQMVGAAPLAGRLYTLQRNLLMTPAPAAKILEHMQRNPSSSEKLFDRYGVRYILGESPPRFSAFMPGLELVADFPSAGQSLWENPGALPMAYLAKSAIAVKENPVEIIIERADLAADVTVTAGVEILPPAEPGREEVSPGKLNVAEFDYDRASYEVEADYRTLLVESALNFPGWQAKIDGKDAPVITVNGFCRGVIIPKGKHRVELSFLSASLVSGIWISVITLIILFMSAVLALFLRLSGNRRKS